MLQEEILPCKDIRFTWEVHKVGSQNYLEDRLGPNTDSFNTDQEAGYSLSGKEVSLAYKKDCFPDKLRVSQNLG